MRWLLIKDLQILRRSPLLLIVLILYSGSIALMIGAATRDRPGKPKVAFLNEIRPQDDEIIVGGQRLKASRYADELFRSVTPVAVKTRAEAEAKVRNGDVLAAIIVPANTTERLRAALTLSGTQPPPTLDVIYNGADPIQARAVAATIKGRLADANRAISSELTRATADYIHIVLRGGGFDLFDRDFEVLGLERSEKILDQAIRELPRQSKQRAELERVRDFAHLAVASLNLAGPVINSVGEPLKVQTQVVNARSTPDDRYYVAVALTLSALFVALLLAAGMLSLEREEHTYSRLTRGLISPLKLIGAKVTLGAIAGLLVTVVMTAGIALFVPLSLGSAPLWLAVLALACLAFGAIGVALGALAPDVRAASLLAVLISLPIAFLALIPPSAVGSQVYDLIRIVGAPFAFRPALDAVDGALSGDLVGWPIVHLVILTVAYCAIARLAIRRLA